MNRVVIPIADPNYQMQIKEIGETIDKIMSINEQELIQYGMYAEKFPDDFYRGVLILMWRESIELADGIRSLTLGSSCNVIPILLRSLFEIYLGIAFIFLDKELVTKRALAYSAVNLLKRIESYKKFDSSDPTYNDFRNNLSSNICETISSDFDVKAAKENLESIFTKYPEYSEVKKEYDQVVSRKKKQGRRHPQPQWYELFGGCSSIFQLSEMLGMKEFYMIVYDKFSQKAHGLESMNSWTQGCLKNPKVPDLSELGSEIDLMLTFLSGITKNILQFEVPNQVQNFAVKHALLRKETCIMASNLKKMKFIERRCE